MNIWGEKIILRAMEIEDMELLRNAINDSQTEYDVLGWSYPISRTAQLKWYEKVVLDKNDLRFIIEDINTHQAVGMANLVDIDWKNRNAFHGIKLFPTSEKHKGYGTDTVMAIMKYAFDELQLCRLDGAMIENNIGSLNLYGKCGWKREGVRRKAVFKNGKYYDQICVGVLKDDYLEARKCIGWMKNE